MKAHPTLNHIHIEHITQNQKMARMFGAWLSEMHCHGCRASLAVELPETETLEDAASPLAVKCRGILDQFVADHANCPTQDDWTACGRFGTATLRAERSPWAEARRYPAEEANRSASDALNGADRTEG